MNNYHITVPFNGLIAEAIIVKAASIAAKLDIVMMASVTGEGALYFTIVSTHRTAQEFAREMRGSLNVL